MKDEEIDTYSRNTEIVAKMRGAIIQFMVEFEHHLDNIIAFVYCGENPEKRSEFMSVILGKESFGLSSKEAVVTFIIKKHYPTFYIKHKDGIDKMTSLVSKRNKYAHHKFIHDGKSYKNMDYWELVYPTTSSDKIITKKTSISQKAYQSDLKEIENGMKIIYEFLYLLGLRTS